MNGQRGDLRPSRQVRSTIAVGIDGSVANRAAVLWAATLAQRSRMTLEVIHVADESLRSSRYATIGEVRRVSDSIIAGAVGAAASAYPDLQVIPRQLFGDPSRMLGETAERAQMLVLGRRGRGSFSRMLLGSVSAVVAHQSTLPTAVIPAGWDSFSEDDSPIAVGIDGSRCSDAALRYAVQLAGSSGRSCRVIHVWGQPDPALPAGSAPRAHGDLDGQRAEAARLLTTAIAPWRSTRPTPVMREVLRRGHIVQTLADESESADVLVLGGHGTGRQAVAVVGSTTHGVLHHAGCPVIVVPEAGDPLARAD